MTGTGDTFDANDDRTVTRSEERLGVSTERRVSGRVRVQKVVTTEMVTVEVPVRREEVRLVHEPVEGDDLPDLAPGYPTGAPRRDDLVLVLHEERPVVTTAVVPVERVRVVVDEVTTTETVSGEVRAEHVEVDGDAVSGTAPR